MLIVLGNEVSIPAWLTGVNPVLLSFVANTLAWLGVGLILCLLLTHVFKWITRRIPGDADDVILGVIRKPAVVIAVLLGIINDLEILPIPAELLAFVKLVGFKAFGASSVDIAVEFYIDDIRLEHCYRRSRGLTEVGIGIFNVFRREGIEIPFPQTDAWFRDKPVNVAIARDPHR